MAHSESSKTSTASDFFNVVDTPMSATDSHASLSSATLPPYDITIASVPVPKETYMIRNIDTGRAITVEEGHLTLKLPGGTRGGWHWHCVERDGGWLGFREAVSGKYLGRDGMGGFQVKFNHFVDWESFCLRPLEEGGYHLLVLEESNNRYSSSYLHRMGISDDGELVMVNTAAEATRWEFVKV
ncbi:hypothetical protein F5X97DRAFT_339373 [Nemania serpens]|nr:hypothetical protein F5X97DRAFT_339373 [Nemania serpens]